MARGVAELYGLDFFPCAFLDDLKFWDIRDNPEVFWIKSGLTPASVWVFYEHLPIVNNPTEVELIVENAISSLSITVDGRCIPTPSSWAWNLLFVQRRRNFSGTFTCNILRKIRRITLASSSSISRCPLSTSPFA